GIAWTQRREHDDDLHARAESTGIGSEEPFRLKACCGETRGMFEQLKKRASRNSSSSSHKTAAWQATSLRARLPLGMTGRRQKCRLDFRGDKSTLAKAGSCPAFANRLRHGKQLQLQHNGNVDLDGKVFEIRVRDPLS